jgi:hypothetical protein
VVQPAGYPDKGRSGRFFLKTGEQDMTAYEIDWNEPKTEHCVNFAKGEHCVNFAKGEHCVNFAKGHCVNW